MEHVTHIELENFLSFRKAGCRLSPFTLVVGANNSGKSNLLRAVETWWREMTDSEESRLGTWTPFHGCIDAAPKIHLRHSNGATATVRSTNEDGPTVRVTASEPWPVSGDLPVYRLNPEQVGTPEEEETDGAVRVMPDGQGVSRVLKALKDGPPWRQRVAAQIEVELSRCVPEILSISLSPRAKNLCALEVKQLGLPHATPLAEVSEGTRLVLAILTIVHVNRQPILLLEDIDRAVHPWLFEKLVDFLRGLTRAGRVQIIATCHNPYLVDEFKDEPEAVVIVEKKDGASVLSNMDERIAALRKNGEMEMPLGEVWFRGFAGGVPQPKLPDLLRVAETP